VENELVVSGKTYRAVDDSGERMRLVCVDNRGLLFVGKCDLSGENEWIAIRGARCVIRWGTTGHVAELCAGPLENTHLGATADVTVRRENIVFTYEVDPEAWK
jgi:hypothetical protein